ncbi:hypothetical protein G6L37_13665 [Agrobacterium rubi]|uniref:hypothetical protein n=1 Tax=Agrobacterium rubi TaxID=28099 RepID=UPI001574BAAF|nr:hypothetical protein [Agrobacterium rubi]NTF07195.1 hypothetical protein [Agrobacterium rubi]NTF19451.1 hypothetical protein [Agrobacterium rubi]NTF26414.1 hypothetical protein [Agrobacterium rubi]
MWSPDASHIITAEQKAAEQRASLEAMFSSAIQDHLDTTAKQRRYDTIHTAISYRDDANPVFASEAAALFAWRSAVWTYSTAELDKVMAGERDIPTMDAFLAELPEIVWP